MAEYSWPYARHLIEEGDYAGNYDVDHPGRIDTFDDQILLATEIADGLGIDCRVACAGTSCTVITERDLSSQEQDDLDAIVAAHQAGGRVETLEQAKLRCAADCSAFRDAELEAGTVEYPAANGTYWSTCQCHAAEWTRIAVARDDLSYPFNKACEDSAGAPAEYTFPAAANVKACFDAIEASVHAECLACDAAVGNVMDAASIPAAEAARDAYTGGS